MRNEILESYKLHNWRFKSELIETLKRNYGEVNPLIVKYYEQLLFGRVSPLKTGDISLKDEQILLNFDKDIPLAVYNNVYGIVKEKLSPEEDNIALLKNAQGYKVVTKDIDGLSLPIFEINGQLELTEKEKEIPNIDIRFYQTEFNKQLRKEYIESLYDYYLKLMAEHSDVSFYLAKLDELCSRVDINRESEIELMSIQLDYRERILAALEMQPKEFYAKTYPHIYPDGKTLTRKKLGVNVQDKYIIY